MKNEMQNRTFVMYVQYILEPNTHNGLQTEGRDECLFHFTAWLYCMCGWIELHDWVTKKLQKEFMKLFMFWIPIWSKRRLVHKQIWS